MVCAVVEVIGLCCRGGKLVRVSAGGSLVVSGRAGSHRRTNYTRPYYTV